ncbi:transcriptional regulator, AraC family [Pelagibacterium halotolerans B2]|uniref:Transcriptional regulator, AraC family n=1 Tax=Pelagibacterium halotolerans (strain DSM 22347 / JCM 15775 / CGMCC 1.7692 / B2) TaxID=1082931 RepID=G4RCB7_PELHB|nr:transcriptional regulator, AraC family [Pelagibacterium halotolerans B2]
MPLRVRLDLAQEVESQTIASTLDTTQWTLHGRRNRVFVLISGTGSIHYRDEATGLQAPSLVWVPTGQPATLTLYAGSRGAWLAISDAALSQIALPGNIGDDLRRISARPQLGTRLTREVANRLATLIGIIEDELREGPAGSQEMVRHQLAIVSILLWRSSDLVPNDAQPAPRTVVSNFLHLVDQQMRSHWSVADYARYLGVSTDRLNSAVQRATGQAPLALIHARLMAEARQMIETSGMHISEIATVLGFDDPAYFSRFFKRLTGKSPRQYRIEFTRSQIRMSGSFAAWP